MSTTIPIATTVNASVSAVAITALYRSDNGLAPTGVSFPIALSAGTPPLWSGSFVETGSVPAFYWNPNGPIGQVTFSAGGNGTFQGTILGTGITAGLYSTVLQANGIYGPDNISLWSIRGATGVFDPSWQQLAYGQADSEIASEFAQQSCALPGALSTQTPGTQLFASVQQLGQIEAKMMGAFLYQANGLQDAAKGMDGKVTSRLEESRRQLKELLFLNRGKFAYVGGFSNAPFAVPPNVDPSGNPVAPQPPYPVARWNGWWFTWGGGNGCGGGIYSGCA